MLRFLFLRRVRVARRSTFPLSLPDLKGAIGFDDLETTPLHYKLGIRYTVVCILIDEGNVNKCFCLVRWMDID